MTQTEINRAVARATGETVHAIGQQGFVLLTHRPFERDPEDLIIDWDDYDLRRNVAWVD